MDGPRGAPGLERGAAADLWQRTLAQIPTLFGRLVYLCSLREQNTGRYEHFGLAQMFEQVVEGVIERGHGLPPPCWRASN